MDRYKALNDAAQYCVIRGIQFPPDLIAGLKSIGVNLRWIKGLTERAALECKLKRALQGTMGDQMERMLRIIGDPPDFNKLNESFWTESTREFQRAVSPILQDAFIQQVSDFIEYDGIGVDWGLVNTAASDWARQYTYNLVHGINQTTRDWLQGSIGDYYSQGWTMGDLESQLERFYGPIRAEMIAVTEVTRASVQGELAAAREVSNLNPNVQMIPIWQTNNDELVCDICGPYNQKTDEVWGGDYPDGPPAHPRCRCWLNHDVKVNE